MGSKKVMIAMSGGVDSAVAALLLQKRGYEIAGGTFRLWDGAGTADVEDAKAVCDKLGIRHYVFDFREEFRREVMDAFAGEYERGATPNPCIVCNRTIKFGVFLQRAMELGFDYISTGHYAHVLYDEAVGRYRVRKADYASKDQSYVLYSLAQEQLSRVLLPLGGCDKPQVREIAAANGLTVGQKAESQDICFIPDGDYAAFLREYLKNDGKPGHFVDLKGNILGEHKGVRHYTVGQRRGVGLSFARPMFVADIDGENNTVTLAPNDALMKSGLFAENVNWIDFADPPKRMRLQVKIRYGAKPAAATVIPLGDSGAGVMFDEPQRAITKGQSAVFYDGEYLAGGGIIADVNAPVSAQ